MVIKDNITDDNGNIIINVSSSTDDAITLATAGTYSDKNIIFNMTFDTPLRPEGKSYLTFSSPNSFTLKVNDTTKHWNGTLEYSTNTSTWSTWDGTTTLSSATSGSKNVLYLRGTGNTVIIGNDYNYRWVLTGSNIACIGNIENLLDYATVKSGSHPTMAGYCYANMFYGCTSLIQAPALPATTLADHCYNGMFYGCTSLIKVPALLATTLAEFCYSGMFWNCTSLTQAPALPATTLADHCYYAMFHDCTSLAQAPVLPATTLADYCYSSMFYGCTSLTHAPALPAITLTSNCYSFMFYNCTALTQAPALPATTLALNCYYSMFYNCTALTRVPALPATTLETYCYRSMFSRCTSLKLSSIRTGEYTQEYRIPSSGTGTTATDALTDMFTSTGGTFTGTPSINTTYYLSSDNMVVRETEIATLREYVGSMIDAPFKPEGKSYLTFSSPNSFTLTVNNATKHWDGTLEYFASNKTWTVWGGITTLSSVDNDGEHVLYLRGTGNTKITGNSPDYRWVLTGSDIACIGNIENLLDYATVESRVHPTMAPSCYAGMFFGCTSLTQAPALPATTLATSCYNDMFRGCTSLAQAPALPATALAYGCYQAMFYNCTSLIQAPALPATTLATGCYNDMFRDCTSLAQAPVLPATTLVDYCYSGMFYGCTDLTQAPALPATTLATNCYQYMFYGCTSLKLSTTQTGEYAVAYRIPTTGTGTTANSALFNMFTDTGGTFTRTPEINKTYYLSSDNMVVYETEIATLNGYVGSMINNAVAEVNAVPSATTNDNDKVLMVINGVPTWVAIINAEGVKY